MTVLCLLHKSTIALYYGFLLKFVSIFVLDAVQERRLITELEKSAAIMMLYDVEFALASLFRFLSLFLLNVTRMLYWSIYCIFFSDIFFYHFVILVSSQE